MTLLAEANLEGQPAKFNKKQTYICYSWLYQHCVASSCQYLARQQKHIKWAQMHASNQAGNSTTTRAELQKSELTKLMSVDLTHHGQAAVVCRLMLRCDQHSSLVETQQCGPQHMLCHLQQRRKFGRRKLS